MCVVLQHILARETLRSPVASLWLLALCQETNPLRTSKTYRRFITRKRRLRSPPAPPLTNLPQVGCAPSVPPMDHGQHFGCWISSRVFAPCITTKERPWMRFFLGAAQTRHTPATPPFFYIIRTVLNSNFLGQTVENYLRRMSVGNLGCRRTNRKLNYSVAVGVKRYQEINSSTLENF